MITKNKKLKKRKVATELKEKPLKNKNIEMIKNSIEKNAPNFLFEGRTNLSLLIRED